MIFVDSHCHVSAPLSNEEIIEIGEAYEQLGVEKVVVMSSNHIDGDIVYKVGQLLPNKVIPSIGVHPWYSHIFYVGDKPINKKAHYSEVFKKEVDVDFLKVLPQPIDFNKYFDKMLEKFQDAFSLENIVIGEIGLDKLTRVPTNGYYGRDAFEGRPPTADVKFSNYKTSMRHQKSIFNIQVQKAMERDLPMSIHCVKAMSHIIETFQKSTTKPTKTSHLMLHSYTGSIESLKRLLKYVGAQQLYISVSSLLNHSRLDEFKSVINADHILMESDVSIQNTEFQLSLLKDLSVDIAKPLETLVTYLSRD